MLDRAEFTTLPEAPSTTLRFVENSPLKIDFVPSEARPIGFGEARMIGFSVHTGESRENKKSNQ